MKGTRRCVCYCHKVHSLHKVNSASSFLDIITWVPLESKNKLMQAFKELGELTHAHRPQLTTGNPLLLLSHYTMLTGQVSNKCVLSSRVNHESAVRFPTSCLSCSLQRCEIVKCVVRVTLRMSLQQPYSS